MKKLNYILGGLLMMVSFTNIHAQNNCADAASFTSNAQPNMIYCFDNASVNTLVGAVSGSNPAAACGTPELDIWTQFTITSGPLDILIEASGYNTGNGANERDLDFEVYSSTGPCAGLVSIGCANTNIAGGAESLSLSDLANGTYYVRFYSDINGGNGPLVNADLCLTATTPVPPATNDDCASAFPIAVGANGICAEVTATNVGATASPGVPAPSCAGYLGGDVWFSVVVPASGNVTFATDYSTPIGLTDTDMALYTGICGALTEIACDDMSGNGVMSSISASGLTPGETIFVRVWEFGNDETGSFDLCFSEPAPSDANQDCSISQGICTDASIGGASDGSGLTADLNATNQGCMSTEHQANWYNLEISTPGVFEFIVSPDNGTDDYDIAVWVYPGGAGQACPPTVAPTRCTWAGGGGDTGLQNGSGDVTEGAAGDKFVDGVNVNVGDVIVLLIDNFSSTTSPFTLDFTGTAGLDCAVVLPIELTEFYGESSKTGNRLFWQTASEYNNDYFTLEHSMDAASWRVIGSVNGNGNTTETQRYAFDHTQVVDGVNYYKLYQTDIDGTESDARIVSLSNTTSNVLVKTINLIGQEVDVHYKGVVIDLFNDGSSVKRLQ